LLGAGIFGANYNGANETESYAGSAQFTFKACSFNSGELLFGFAGVSDGFDDNPQGLVSMTLTLNVTDGGTLYNNTWTFDDVADLDTFLSDDVGDPGDAADPEMTVNLKLRADVACRHWLFRPGAVRRASDISTGKSFRTCGNPVAHKGKVSITRET
jgi:hypothetical protein